SAPIWPTRKPMTAYRSHIQPWRLVCGGTHGVSMNGTSAGGSNEGMGARNVKVGSSGGMGGGGGMGDHPGGGGGAAGATTGGACWSHSRGTYPSGTGPGERAGGPAGPGGAPP